MNTPHWKELLEKCLDQYIPDTEILSTLHKEEYRELFFQELYSRYLKTNTFDYSLEETSFIYKYFALNNTQALKNCVDILKKIGDDSFTINVLSHAYIDKSSSIIQLIIDKYLPIMVKNNCYLTIVLENELFKEEQIETLIQGIERSIGGNKNLYNLSYLFNNPNISSSQLDRVAFLLKKRSNSFSTWLHLAIHPNLDITIIKNHLYISGFNSFLERYTENIKQIAERNQNKSNIHKIMLLNWLPILANFGLTLDPLDFAIEVLEEDYSLNT